MANFVHDGGGVTPTGAINGLFSTSPTQQVYFSQGNLQYQASTNTWRFADHQYECIGSNNSSISPTYSGWIDLFGWGTSGYNHGAVCYQPWSVSSDFDAYYAYGNPSYNLFDQTGQADWGYNQINNGGNAENTWRTLTQSEWAFVFCNRMTDSGVLFAKASVNGINGVILLPDNWNLNNYSLNAPNDFSASYSNNIINASAWAYFFEGNGAVFLPITGVRSGNSVGELWSGHYWTSTCGISGGDAKCIYFDADGVFLSVDCSRPAGFGVRLVKNL